MTEQKPCSLVEIDLIKWGRPTCGRSGQGGKILEASFNIGVIWESVKSFWRNRLTEKKIDFSSPEIEASISPERLLVRT